MDRNKNSIPDKIDFKTKAIKRDTGQFIILKGRIYQEDINIISMYVPNTGAPKYIIKILEDFKKDIDSNTLILWVLIPHCQQWIDLPNKVLTRILWHLLYVNDTLDQMDLTSIYRTFHPKEEKYAFFSNVHGTFSKIDHMKDTKQVSTNSGKLKSYQAFSQTTMT